MARKTGKTDVLYPDYNGEEPSNAYIDLIRTHRAAERGQLPGVDPESIPLPEVEEVETFVVKAYEGGELAFHEDGTPVLVPDPLDPTRTVAEVLVEPEIVERIVRADQVEEYEEKFEREKARQAARREASQ